jgi:hypothetical protein
VKRTALPWLLALPTIVAGTEAAHVLAYRLVFADADLRLAFLAATGHGYAHWLPLALAAAAACALVGVGAAAADTARGRRVGTLPPLAFAVLPPLAFALQELLELSLHTGGVAWHAFAEPTFLPGLALQLPFALLAYLAARVLLGAAVRLGRALARPRVARTTAARHDVCNQIAPKVQSDCGLSPRAPPLAAGI